MAIALGAQAVNASPTTLSTTHTATLTLSSGDLAVVLVSNRDGGSTVNSVVGSVNGAYTRVGADQSGGGASGIASIWYFENCSAGNETVTVTFSANARAGVNLSRWTGAATSGALDQNNGANNATGTAHNCGSITTTGAGVVITVYYSTGDEGGVTQTGFTAMTVSGGGALLRDYFGYRIVASSTTEDGDTTTVNSVASNGKIASFNEAAAGGDPEGSLVGGKLIRGGLLMHGVLVR